MGFEAWIGIAGFAGTLLLVLVGLLNFSVFWRQLRLAQEQIDTAVRQLEIAQKQPDLHLIQRAITETTDYVRLLMDHPHLRPYFYDGAVWAPGDQASLDEVKLMAELILNNFASALMHSAAFPQYPVRGIDRTIMFHLRRSAALREFLTENFDRFPFTGLTMLALKSETRAEVEADLQRMLDAPDVDDAERTRLTEIMELYRTSAPREAIEYTTHTMARRR
ncbi:hypothetical protein [Longimicrobium terrae]|uniref:Uncharacterized protein n=1 Tax=Longimicrobium terrae TaxID=1639882 RepID=A0A841H2Q5_9BACT|nr:hypothetical protein [Longimicrobium terrae]MBB4638001.1 hypothetical protein [Longimicrobium terrae]MBB6072248.1 hypothetical protein [Longimicrobium terrae]NNC28331.1 hypothetical protein [Longimicrobium terrae]